MKRAFISSLVSLFLIGGVAFAYFYFQKYRKPGTDIYGYIPGDVSFFVETRSLPDFIGALKNEPIWMALSSDGFLSETGRGVNYLDSILKAPELPSGLGDERTVVISCHINPAGKTDFLFLTRVSELGGESAAEELMIGLIPGAESGKRINNGIEIHELKKGDISFSYYLHNEILALSFAPYLLEESIRQTVLKSPWPDREFLRPLMESAGKKVEANLYVNYANLAKFLPRLCQEDYRETFASFLQLGAWSGFDLKFREKGFSISGFTHGAAEGNFHSMIRDQSPQKMEMAEILPRNTAVLIYTAFSQYGQFRTHQEKNLHAISEGAKKLREEPLLTDWIGNEYALILTQPRGASADDYAFAAFRCNDLASAQQSLNDLALFRHKNANGTGAPPTEKYRGRTIGFIDYPDMLPAVFGKDFNLLKRNYFTILNEYILFANQASLLRTLLDEFDNRRTLSNAPGWQEFKEKLSPTGNRLVFADLKKFLPVLLLAVDTTVVPISQIIRTATAFAFQASGGGEFVYSNTLLFKQESSVEETNLLWSATLDTGISQKPTVLMNPATEEYEIFVQDDGNAIYLFSQNGEMIFKDTIQEEIISEIFQVDYFRNNKWQLMFNTRSRVYLIDRKGQTVRNYPMKLPFAASAGIAVFDFDNKKDYRWYIPCINNRFYAFQLNTRPVEGWNISEKLDYIDRPLQYFQLADKDFLVISDTSGAVFMLDRKGKKRVEPQTPVRTRYKEPFRLYTGHTIAESKIMTQDDEGKLISFYFDGSVSIQALNEVEPSLFRTMADMDGDLVPEYVLLDSLQLKVIAQDTTLLFSHTFEYPVQDPPFSFGKPGEKFKVGIHSKASNQIFLFGEDGQQYPGFPLKGSTPFYFGPGPEEGTFQVVTGSHDKNLYIYLLK